MSDKAGPARTPADEARANGRVVSANVQHPFLPGYATFVLIDGKPKAKIDAGRCRMCARLEEGHPEVVPDPPPPAPLIPRHDPVIPE